MKAYTNLLDILKQNGARNDDGTTVAELSQEMGLCRDSVREALAEAISSGRIAHAGFRTGLAIDGRRTRAPVYKLATAPTAKKK